MVDEPKLSRAERAAQTRNRMLDAAFATFAESGYHGASMAAIAQRGGVAEPTIYFTFHSKAELLQEVLAHAGAAQSEPETAEQRPWLISVLEEPDPRRMIALVVENGTDILQRLAPLGETMSVAAISEPAAAAAMAEISSRRRGAFTRILTAASERTPLAIPVERAVDIMDVVQSAPTFNAFVVTSGWPVAEFKAWSFTVLTQQLMPLPTAAATSSPSPRLRYCRRARMRCFSFTLFTIRALRGSGLPWWPPPPSGVCFKPSTAATVARSSTANHPFCAWWSCLRPHRYPHGQTRTLRPSKLTMSPSCSCRQRRRSTSPSTAT